MQADFDALWNAILDQFAMGEHSIHGPAHWRRVERHAVGAAGQAGGNILVVRLFAVFHDACRLNDSRDDEHGARGAALAARWRGRYFDLPDDAFVQLQFACTWHTDGQVSADPTIGACWDGDRLDLGRVGYVPAAQFMSTDYARALAHVPQKDAPHG